MTRVAITGIGLITALGVGTDATWGALVDGRSGIGPIQGFDPASLRTQIAAEIPDFDPTQFANKRVLRNMTRNDQFGLAGAAAAVADSGLAMDEQDSVRAALFVGGNKEISDPNHVLEATLAARNPDGSVDMVRFGESAMRTAYPLFFVQGLQAASLFYISQAYGLKGANTYFSGTAESGAVAIGRAFRAIRRGEADCAIAGGFDDAVSWWSMTKVDDLEYLSARNDLGAAACRPFDRDRDGTVLGEGAAMVVLEDLDAATGRGARVYAEIVGFGNGFDPEQVITAVQDPEGKALVGALQSALREAGLAPAQIDYVVADGAGTPGGDQSEARALAAVFGEGVAASSVKAATGHLVAGAGALNVAVAALAAHHQLVPPTLNLDHPDPGCPGDWVAGAARKMQVNNVVAVARGFDGQNVALVLRQPERK
jgi:3-oxoacyl-[acyl-carrier-protein] synthase II